MKQDTQPDLKGAAVFGNKEIYGKLKVFKNTISSDEGLLYAKLIYLNPFS